MSEEKPAQALEALWEADELLEQAITNLASASLMLRGSAAARVDQVRAALEMARSPEHHWMGGAMFTLAHSIKEVEALTVGEEV